MLYLPDPPEVAADEQSVGKHYLRYEDICQDGRALLEALPPAMGIVVWRDLLMRHPVTRLAIEQGIIPILTRLILSGAGGRISVNWPVQALGRFQLAHSNGPDGELARLHLNAWVDINGPSAKSSDPPDAKPGPPVEVGHLFAEHVFTRLFAPPDQRKVLSLDSDELPTVPKSEYRWRTRGCVLELPEAATWIDSDLTVADTISFGLNHTDSNQHVNSLVYMKLFEQAALQRLAASGRSSLLLARYAELAYRKPCFAGDRVHLALRTFELDGNPGAVGCFLPDDDADAGSDSPAKRAYCFVRILFAP